MLDGSATTHMPSIGMVGFMVGDDIHLVMWESVGDVVIHEEGALWCLS